MGEHAERMVCFDEAVKHILQLFHAGHARAERTRARIEEVLPDPERVFRYASGQARQIRVTASSPPPLDAEAEAAARLDAALGISPNKHERERGGVVQVRQRSPQKPAARVAKRLDL